MGKDLDLAINLNSKGQIPTCLNFLDIRNKSFYLLDKDITFGLIPVRINWGTMQCYADLDIHLILNQFKIFLDLDGVVADFAGEFRRRFQIWEVDENMEYLLKEPRFFYNLPKIEGTDKFMQFLKSLNIPIQILTALPHNYELPYATSDKVFWVKNNLGDYPISIVSHSRNKYLHCKYKHHILIDDKSQNIDDWRKAGGIGIFHTDFESTICQLENMF